MCKFDTSSCPPGTQGFAAIELCLKVPDFCVKDQTEIVSESTNVRVKCN